MKPPLFWLLVTGYWLLGSSFHAQAETTNRIIAIVNDEVITEGDIALHMSALFQQDDPLEPDDAQAAQMRQAILQRLIEERLIVQEAKRLNVSVDSDEVAQRLAAIREQLGTKEAYEQMLQEARLNEEQLKQKIREQLLAQKVIDRQVRSAIVVSPHELTKLTGSTPTGLNPGEEVRASHLLVRVTDKRSEEEASALISQLHERLLQGEDFAALARRYSEDPHAQDGGLMGWVHQGQLLPELDEALFRLETGELSSPIRTRLGFHLVKVIERRSLSDLEAAEVRQHLERQLYQAKFADVLSTWLGELKARAYIDILDE